MLWKNWMKITDLNSHPQKLEKNLPGGTVVKNPPANAEDWHWQCQCSIAGPGRSHMPRSN